MTHHGRSVLIGSVQMGVLEKVRKAETKAVELPLDRIIANA